MTTPGFNGAVRRTVRPLPSPNGSGQPSARNNGAQRAQRAPQASSGGASRQNAIRSASSWSTGSAKDLLKPILYILIANALILLGILALVSLVLIPLGIVAIVQGAKFGWRGIKLMFS